MKCKFKVGDKIIGNAKNHYLITSKGWVGYVLSVTNTGYLSVSENPTDATVNGFLVNADCFDLFPTANHKIVITTDGKTTTATKYCEDGKKVTATARCAPEDTFDFNVGAELAMERLMEATKPTKYYNGKVVCIKNIEGNKGSYTVGKIYEFVDGILTDDTGWKFPPVKSFEEWNRISSSEWLEIKE